MRGHLVHGITSSGELEADPVSAATRVPAVLPAVELIQAPGKPLSVDARLRLDRRAHQIVATGLPGTLLGTADPSMLAYRSPGGRDLFLEADGTILHADGASSAYDITVASSWDCAAAVRAHDMGETLMSAVAMDALNVAMFARMGQRYEVDDVRVQSTDITAGFVKLVVFHADGDKRSDVLYDSRRRTAVLLDENGQYASVLHSSAAVRDILVDLAGTSRSPQQAFEQILDAHRADIDRGVERYVRTN